MEHKLEIEDDEMQLAKLRGYCEADTFYIIVNPIFVKRHLTLTFYGNHLKTIIKKNFSSLLVYNITRRVRLCNSRLMFQIFV